MKIIKTAAAVAAAVLLTAAPARAERWISLSSWAYDEVSDFVSARLLPEEFNGITDYTRPVTRGEFAALAWSVIDKSAMAAMDDKTAYYRFDDVDENSPANKLYAINVTQGYFRGNYAKPVFCPDNTITREDAGVMVNRIISQVYWRRTGRAYHDEEYLYNNFSDYKEMSDYALESVGYLLDYGIIEGNSGRLEPKSKLSIQEAIVMLDRMYKVLPKLFESDRDTLANTDKIDLGIGIYEIFRDGKYFVREGDATLLELDGDVYLKQFLCEYNGMRLLFAVNFNNKTDVYNLDSGEVLYTIPYIVIEVLPQVGAAVTYSSRFMPLLCGLWDIKSNTEIVSPPFSRDELDEIIENSFEIPVEQRRAPDGRVYYADEDGRIMSVDSNGENERLIMDGYECTEILGAAGGYIYFYDQSKTADICCVSKDGGEVYRFGIDKIHTHYSYCNPDVISFGTEPLTKREREKIYSKNLEYTMDWSVCSEEGPALENGALICEKLYDTIYSDTDREIGTRATGQCMLYNYRISGGAAVKEKIASFPVKANTLTADYKGNIFFLNADELTATGTSPIYMYDGTDTKIISGAYRAICFCFETTSSGINTDKLLFYTKDDDNAFCIDISNGRISEYEYGVSAVVGEYDVLNVNMYNKNGIKISEDSIGAVSVEYGGETAYLGMNVNVMYVEDNYIYYAENSSSYYSFERVRTMFRGGMYKRYDCLTGETRIIADDYGITWTQTNDFLMYCTPLGQYKKISGCDVSCKYPNGGLHRFGEVKQILVMHNSNNRMRVCKLDTDGNILPLTPENVSKWIYVSNDNKQIFKSRDIY